MKASRFAGLRCNRPVWVSHTSSPPMPPGQVVYRACRTCGRRMVVVRYPANAWLRYRGMIRGKAARLPRFWYDRDYCSQECER